ncbi:MAG TPA: C40 family peptidase [Actinospica sp.]|jgi:cell wall-associated NlpC family hydrolase|nr:C40 family peptidase [Actinospica sp.]
MKASVKVGGIAFALSPFGIILGVALVVSGTSADAGSAFAAVASVTSCSTGSAEVGADMGDGETLTQDMMNNAEIIYQTGVGLGVPQYGEVIAVATAIQESKLTNLDYGDRDSLGLFQQRPSQGWGTAAQIMDPVYASTQFYNALLKVPNWQNLPLTVAAQDVQESGFPDAYAQWQPIATEIVNTLSGASTDCTNTDGDGQTTTNPTPLPVGFSLPAGTPTQIVTAVEYAVDQLGKPYIYGGTGPAGYDCSGLIMEAYLAAGISLPRTTYQQVDSGTAVYDVTTSAQLQPGDLIFTMGSDPEGNLPGHVGMYIGDDLVIDAPHTGANVELSKFDGGYWNAEAVAFRRIVN